MADGDLSITVTLEVPTEIVGKPTGGESSAKPTGGHAQPRPKGATSA